MKSLRRETKW